MNERVGKMLSRYARKTSKPPKELKRWWELLNWREKTHERKRILAELAG